MMHVIDHNKFNEEQKHSTINVDEGEYQFLPLNLAQSNENSNLPKFEQENLLTTDAMQAPAASE